MKKDQTSNDKKIAQLEEKIRNLNLELESETGLNEILSESCDNSEKQITNFKQLLKYHTLILIVMNLLRGYTDSNEIGRAIQCNINKYYKGLTDSIMALPTYDDYYDDTDEEYEDEEESGDASID